MYSSDSLKRDTKAVSYKPSMADSEIARTVRFSGRLWDEIDRDAQRCMRSSVKQMEAVLSAYYGIKDVELDRDKFSNERLPAIYRGVPAAPPSQPKRKKTQKVPILDKVK